MTEPLLLVEHQGPVAWLTLNRPEALNALNPPLVRELQAFFDGLYRNPAVRVVVLQGAGRAFCAGLDLKEQLARPITGDPVAAMAQQHGIRDLVLALRRCPQPVISIVHGAASGGGFALALASDIRLATPDARMNAAFIKVGLSGCDIGVSYFLPRMVGASVASEYILTGRFMSAQRAEALGLVSRVGPIEALRDEARALANDMLGAAPMALRLTKDGLTHALDAGSLEAATALEDRQQVLCSQSPEFLEAVNAFLEKRTPAYAQAI